MIRRLTNHFVNGEKVSESITRSAALIAVMGIASRFLGLIRDRILASKFGAGDVLDAYYAAFKTPDLIYGLLVLGAISAAFVPIFTSLISKNDEKTAWRLVNILISVGVIVLGAVSVILFILAPQVIDVLTFGYSDEKKELVTQLTRVMLLSPIILGISGVMGGVLNSFKKFFFYSLAPIMYNVGIIFGALFLIKPFGPMGLALGVVLGALLHLAIQVPEVVRSGFSFQWIADFKDKYLKKVILLMIPRALGIAVAQINLIVVTVLASTLAAGSLAVFTFADNLQSVPLGIFGISFAIAAFPTLSSLWAKGEKEQFITRFTNTLRKVMFFIIPASALIFVLRAQIVRVVLGTGQFDWEDTLLTLSALGVFTFSLWAQGAIPLLARAFYSMQNTLIPFLIGLFSSAVNVTLALLLIDEHGIIGLVWAFSIAAIVNATLLFVVLRTKVGEMKGRGFLKMIGKVLVATVIMITVTQVIKNTISADPFGEDRTFLGVFTQMMVALVGGLFTYIVMGKILNIEEMHHFVAVAKRKMSNRSKLPKS